MKAKGKGGRQEPTAQTFQQHSLPTLAKMIAIMFAFVFLFSACCPPGANSSLSQETAFKATFLGFSKDQHYLLAQPEGSNTNVQMIYEPALTLAIGQRIYVVGRLEGNLVYVSDLRPL